MRKKNYKGAKCTKRTIPKCEGICKTYDSIQYAYADLLSASDEIQCFRVNVLLEGLAEGEYTSDLAYCQRKKRLRFHTMNGLWSWDKYFPHIVK